MFFYILFYNLQQVHLFYVLTELHYKIKWTSHKGY